MPSKGFNLKKIHNFFEEYFNLFIIGLILVMLLLAYFLVISPKINTIVSSIQNDVNNQQTILLSQRTRLENIQNSLDLYRSIKEADLERIQLVLPDYYPPEKLFGDIEDITLQHGIILSSLSVISDTEFGEASAVEATPGPTAVDGRPSNVGEIKLSMNLSAIDYVAMKRFLPILETQLPPLKIENLGFSSGGEDLSLSATTYYFKP